MGLRVKTSLPNTGVRQPVHVVYGGAHLFRADTAKKLGTMALAALEKYAPDGRRLAAAIGVPALEGIYPRVVEKLRREPVEDYRLDFEDGYGHRSDAEEDGHSISAAGEVVAGMKAGTLPPFIGIRIKPLTEESRARSIRTLDLFFSAMLPKGLPPNFVVTLPKVTAPGQVRALAAFLGRFEKRFRLSKGSLKLELMIETTQAIPILMDLLDAARGRCIAAHFGAYDYTASCGITAAHQHMTHPACDFARHSMQVAYSGAGIHLSDGATNIMPIGDEATVHRAWKLHYEHTQHSLVHGFYQGWDLHPAQLPTRYAAVYAFFLEGLAAAAERLKNFVAAAAQATLVGDVFDDAATGQGLLNYFLRATNCGAITAEEARERTSLTEADLRSGSFAKILDSRRS